LGPLKGKKTSENRLVHPLQAHLDQGDVVLADRYYGSSWEIALLRPRGLDVVMRLQQRRKGDFHCGRSVGHEAHSVLGTKPVRPAWMDEAT
jgi:hypothetical protein